MIEHGNKNPGIAMEIGMHQAVQCLSAARRGLQAHCVEPSPTSFNRVKHRIGLQDSTIKSRIHLYNNAAGKTSGEMVQIEGSGQSGDFVGDKSYDIWAMERKEVNNSKTNKPVNMIATKSLDDIIQSTPEKHAYVIKIDVQGYEPQVIEGLSSSLQNKNVKYILLEYWPKGIDFINDELGTCNKPVKMLENLAKHGYSLYTMAVVNHPAANVIKPSTPNPTPRPFYNITENCLWYYKHEKDFQSKDYNMGYWSDILAVAPGFVEKSLLDRIWHSMNARERIHYSIR